MKIIFLFFVSLTILFSCKKEEKIAFKIPIGYQFNSFQEFYKFEDSIINIYDSITTLKKPFKTLGNIYLSDSVTYENQQQKYELYKEAEPFNVYIRKNHLGEKIKINYNINKAYFVRLYEPNPSPNPNPNPDIPPEIIISEFNKKLKEDNYYKKTEKENIKTTFIFLVSAFSKKYGKYNYLLKENKKEEKSDYTTYYWLKDGIKISISYSERYEDENFNPYNGINEKGVYVWTGLFSPFNISYLGSSLSVNYENIKAAKEEELFEASETQNEEKKIEKARFKKKQYDDSIRNIKVELIRKKL